MMFSYISQVEFTHPTPNVMKKKSVKSTNPGVSKNRGMFPPKWMVYFMENPMNKWMIWGVKTHHFWKHPNPGVSLALFFKDNGNLPTHLESGLRKESNDYGMTC